MGFVRKRLFRRFGVLGLIADIVIVGGALVRFAHRRGWVSDDQVARAGLASWSAANPLSVGEIALASAAAYRLARRRTHRGRSVSVVAEDS